MKAINAIVYSILFFLVACLPACESPVQTIIGEYSFQVSGQVTKDGTQDMVLPNETGTMEIIHLDASNVLLTFSTTDGSAYTTQAVLNGNQLELHPFLRTVVITYKTKESNILGGLIELTETEYYNTSVYGSGTIYDKTIVFDLRYFGEELNGNKTITGNKIILLANKK